METCAECGKTIEMGQPSYYRKNPADDIGQTFHSDCGDPLGIKAKDAEIKKLQHEVHELKRTRSEAEAAATVLGFRSGEQMLRKQFYALVGAPEVERLRSDLANTKAALAGIGCPLR